MQHTGTHYIFKVLGGEVRKPPDFGRARPGDVLWWHFYHHKRHLERYLHYPVVTPLRHPVAVAISWWSRGQDGFEQEWETMTRMNLNSMFFPVETKPFDELEKFTGRKVNRSFERENSKHCEERDMWDAQDIEGLKKSKASHCYDIGIRLVERDPIARRFYAE